VWPAREAKLEAGAFEMPDIPDGVYGVEAVAAASTPGQAEFASIPLENVAPDQHVTLALAQAYRVPVRVVDVDDNPIAGARVTLGNAHIGLLQRVAKTGADGRAELGPVVSGPYVVRADADGMLAGDPAAVAVENATPEEIVLKLARPARIAGIVVDQYDRPVEGAVVEVGGEVPYSAGEGSMRARVFDRTLVSGGSLGVTTGPVPDIPAFMPDRASSAAEAGMLVSDADGRFALSDVAPGAYRLQASHGRYAMSDVVLVTVKAGGGAYEVRLRLRHGERVTGRVLDGNLRPLAGASVDVDDGTVWTDERGVFDAGPRTGTVVLVARSEGTVPVRREIEVGSRPVDVEIVLVRAEAVVRGHVVDDNLRPLANARVTLRSNDAVMPTELAWTNDRGEFAFETLPLGSVELHVDAPGHAARTIKARAVETGREVPIEIVMVAGWHLSVDVRDRDTDDPIAGAEVVCEGVFARTNARGIAEFDALSDDDVEIDVAAEGYGSRGKTVRRKGDRVEVVVELAQGGSLEGVVTDWRGDPITSAQVVIKVGDSVVLERRTDARGMFFADGIPEGDVVLEAWPPAEREEDLAPVAQRSDVLRGRTTRGIDLRLERK
jgi:protocatechuate 3,4-dioxygenase beta subunit